MANISCSQKHCVNVQENTPRTPPTNMSLSPRHGHRHGTAPPVSWREGRDKKKITTMITYNAEGVKMPKLKKRETTAWIRAVAGSYGYKVGEVGYMFVDDEKILEVNNEFLGHDYYTDVITFDYDEPGIVSGDIIISLDTVRSNAEKFGKDYEEELRRVIIHGILHLCGINDKGPGEREIMEEAENKALAMHP